MNKEIIEREGAELDLLSSKQAQIMVAAFFAGIVPLEALIEFLGLGLEGLVIGGVGAAVLAAFAPMLIKRLPGLSIDWQEVGMRLIDADYSSDKAKKVVESTITSVDENKITQLLPETEDRGDIFMPQSIQHDNGIDRLTIDQIVSHIEPNSYKIFIGRSLTKEGNPAITINIYKKHFKFIGASQKGKSSMAAAFLDIVTRTHDRNHVLVALLDLEDQTSKLFADLPHLVRVDVNGKSVKLHARSQEQVLEYLTYLVAIMNKRYQMSKLELMELPIILVYVEEFLALKNYFKTRMNACKGEEKDQAKADYAQLIYNISELARRGLKARVQLLLCAQVDYRDEDLQEALINITCGMSFCVRVTAAQAAGFYNTELLTRNVKEDKIGQAVVEMPDCKDLVLSPEYDLEKRLIAQEEAELEQERRTQKRDPFALAGVETQIQTQRLYPVASQPQERMPDLQPKPVKKQGPSLLDRGINAYLEGAITQPKLAAVLNISPWEARNLMAQVEAELARREANG